MGIQWRRFLGLLRLRQLAKERRMRKVLILGFLVLGTGLGAQQGTPTSPFIRESASVIAITHVELIDGTGAAPAADQTVIIDHGKIGAVGASGSVSVPPGAKVIDGSGKTVIPGMVAMHEHLFYPLPGDEALFQEEAYDFPPLYLASGVTTGRTTGSLEPYADFWRETDDRQRGNGRAELGFDRAVPARGPVNFSADARTEGCE
jgi:hypothetical protein